MKNKSKALPLTITLGSILLVFCLLLTILWNFVLIYNFSKIEELSGPIKDYSGYFQWIILFIGSFFFIVIIVGVTLFMIFLARQIVQNQLQKNFIDSVTHELKTPLTSLKLYIETLKKHELSKDKKDFFLNTMLKDVDRLDNLVNHVLEAAKLENIHKNYKFKELDLQSLISGCAESIISRYNISQDAISLNVEPLMIKSDPVALQLIIMNLLDNAVKYSNENIKVIVAANTSKDQKVDITIQDFGEGIPKSELKNIFRRFYRTAEHLSGNKKGSGLGLFIVNETIKNIKGKIEVYSEGKGKGTLFRISLPSDKEYA